MLKKIIIKIKQCCQVKNKKKRNIKAKCITCTGKIFSKNNSKRYVNINEINSFCKDVEEEKKVKRISNIEICQFLVLQGVC